MSAVAVATPDDYSLEVLSNSRLLNLDLKIICPLSSSNSDYTPTWSIIMSSAI